MREYRNKGKDILCPWIRTLNIKMALPLQATHRCKAMPFKILASFFADIDKLIFDSYEKQRTVKIILKNKNKVRGLTLPNLET